MCEPMSMGLAMAGVGLVGGVMQAKDKAKAEAEAEDSQRRTAREMAKEMNMANANLNLQAVDKAEEAFKQLSDINMESLRNQGTVAAAIGESGLSGNSMDRIRNSVANEASQQKVAVTDNYKRDYASILGSQIANTENTKSAIRGQSKIFRTSKLSHALGIASSTAGGAATGASLGSQLKGDK